MLHALLFSDDMETVLRLSDVFRETGFVVHAVGTLAEVRSTLSREIPDVAVMDYDALGLDGVAFLKNSRLGNVIELMLMTSSPEYGISAQELGLGAADSFQKPVDPEHLRVVLERIAVATQPGADGAGTVKAAGLGIMHGDSLPMRRLFALIRKVSRTDMTVLLIGDIGVGKELGAQMIHALSDLSAGPLVAVNCGAYRHASCKSNQHDNTCKPINGRRGRGSRRRATG